MPALLAQVFPQLRDFGLALQHKAVLAVLQPWGSVQNGDHGIGAHTGADHSIKIPGNVSHAVGQVKLHFLPDAESLSIADGAHEGLLIHIGSDGGPGYA